MYFSNMGLFLSVMALAIMGTNAVAAGQPKSGLEERACSCNYGDGTYADCVRVAEGECTATCLQDQVYGGTAYAIRLNDCANAGQRINCCGC